MSPAQSILQTIQKLPRSRQKYENFITFKQNFFKSVDFFFFLPIVGRTYEHSKCLHANSSSDEG